MAAFYTFEDLSGSTSDGPKTDNPYHDLIASCKDDPAQIQKRYDTHRTNRNAQQKEKLLSKDFPGVTIDEILAKLENPQQFQGYQDPRHCLVFWARPSKLVRDLISEVQRRLQECVPNIWLMPSMSQHMTALEITHSLTSPEVEALASQVLPHAETITDFTLQHRARLVKPTVSFDAQALALSWLPAAGEQHQDPDKTPTGDAYTYHHLRRDLVTLVNKAGVTVASRYVIPSAHLTIARFITKSDFETATGGVDHEKVAKLVETIEGINAWLQEEYWPKDDGKAVPKGGEWIIGEEKGLDFRKGDLWYGGGGETVKLGKGF